MTRQPDVDQLVESWLAEGPSRMPDRVVDNIVSHIEENPQPGSFWPRRRIKLNRMTLAVAGVAALAIGLAGIGLAFGPTGPGIGTPGPTVGLPSYEAVFVRREASGDILLVLGVDVKGTQRVIARLPGAWPSSRPPTPAPAGAVSTTGLLALAAFDTGGNSDGNSCCGPLSWIVLDLLRPTEPPIVIDGFPQQDTDQLDYFFLADRTTGRDARPWWGPADRLAIYSFERIPMGGNGFTRSYFLAFADGRTGESTFVETPEAEGLKPPDGWLVLPHWTPDGSGIFVEVWARGLQVLRPDGTLVPAADPVPNPICLLPEVPGDEWRFATCASPDDALVVTTGGDVSFPTGSLTVQASGEVFEIAGSFAGWLKDGN